MNRNKTQQEGTQFLSRVKLYNFKRAFKKLVFLLRLGKPAFSFTCTLHHGNLLIEYI